MSDAILLAAADPAWPRHFQAARDELLPLFDPPPLRVEHVGSTAVAGLDAKPVIDLIVQVSDMAPVRARLSKIAALGYEFRPEVSNGQRLFFRRMAADGARTHHLHVHTDPEDVERHVLFRDLLRADKALREDYLALKLELADRHRDDRRAYSEGKNAFVDAAIAAAGGPPRRPFWNS